MLSLFSAASAGDGSYDEKRNRGAKPDTCMKYPECQAIHE